MEESFRFYAAYGSNLSCEQMKGLCPDAVPVGTASLHGWKLLFKGAATVDPVEGCSLPVVIWRVSPDDEARLDRFEGFPETYEKCEAAVSDIRLSGGESATQAQAFFYRKPDRFPLRTPRHKYFLALLDAYRHWGFPVMELKRALYDSADEGEAECFLRMNRLEGAFD